MVNIEQKNLVLNRILKYTSFDIKTGCFKYYGTIQYSGHGRLTINGKTYQVHRLSAYIFLGFDLNSNLQINHKLECSNKNCWNPEHIYVGTQIENLYDLIISGKHNNASKTHCPLGHEYNKENTYYNNSRRNCIICRKVKNDIRNNRRKGILTSDPLPVGVN